MGVIEERQDALRREYCVFPDAQELFEYIIEKNKAVPPLPEELKRDEFLVKGCVSSLWLVPGFADGKCSFKSDADSLITRGVAALVCSLYDGLTPREVLAVDPSFFDAIGVSSNLSPNRRNGLGQLCSRIRSFAERNAPAEP